MFIVGYFLKTFKVRPFPCGVILVAGGGDIGGLRFLSSTYQGYVGALGCIALHRMLCGVKR